MQALTFAIRSSSIAILTGALCNAVSMAASAEQVLYAIGNEGPSYLSVVNPLTGAEISSVLIDLPGEDVRSGNGLAVNPVTNEMYAAVKLLTQPGVSRNLIKIDPNTGGATNIGVMAQPIASLAFTDSGALYAVSGDCANGCGGTAIAETLFKVSTGDASLTLVKTLGNGGEGEAIAFNPNDGMMYHMSGSGLNFIFEKIDLTSGAITSIPLSGDTPDTAEATGFTFDRAQNLFVGSLIDWSIPEAYFGTVTAGGVMTSIGLLPVHWKDYAFYELGSNVVRRMPIAITILLGDDDSP